MTALTSNVQKGGALLDDTRRLIEAWIPVSMLRRTFTRRERQPARQDVARAHR